MLGIVFKVHGTGATDHLGKMASTSRVVVLYYSSFLHQHDPLRGTIRVCTHVSYFVTISGAREGRCGDVSSQPYPIGDDPSNRSCVTTQAGVRNECGPYPATDGGTQS